MCSSCDNNIKEHIIKKLLTQVPIEDIDLRYLTNTLLFCLDDELKQALLEYKYLDTKLSKKLYTIVLEENLSISVLDNNFYYLIVFLVENNKIVFTLEDILKINNCKSYRPINMTRLYVLFYNMAENNKNMNIFDMSCNGFLEYIQVYKGTDRFLFDLLIKLGFKRNKKYEEAIDLLINETNLLDGYY